MARALSEIKAYIQTDGDGAPQGRVLFTYKVTDGAASKTGEYADETPDFNKTVHNSGAVGEFWRDAIDAIKTAEGIS